MSGLLSRDPACIEDAAGLRFERVVARLADARVLQLAKARGRGPRRRIRRRATGAVRTGTEQRREHFMQAELLHQDDGQRMFVVILRTGDEVLASLGEFADREGISAAQISAIGALSDVELKYFDWDKKKYEVIAVDEQVEVASLLGDIALSPEGKPALHLHIVVGRRNGAAMAGHLGRAHVRPTLEVIVTEAPAHLRKQYDPESGLALVRRARRRERGAMTL